MATLFEDNLRVLETHRPELYQLLVELKVDREQYRRVTARNGLTILEIANPHGRPIPLHSRHDPQRESERAVEPIARNKVSVPILLGIGMGYELYSAWTRHRDRFYDLLAVERDPQIFCAALESLPLGGLLRDKRVHIVLGDDSQGLSAAIRRLLPGIMSSGLTVIENRGAMQLAGPFYQLVLDRIQQTLKKTSAEFTYMAKNGARLQYNVWANFPEMLGQAGLCHAAGLWAGKPGVLVGAGPSLTKNVDLLGEIRDRALLVCVDTAYRVLEARGIEPHIVVATDPTELEVNHFHQLRFSGDPLLAFDPEVYPAIPRDIPWRKLVINLEKSATTRWFEEQGGPWGLFEKGGSVAHTAWMILEVLRADPVILVGMDLAFSRDGGGTHAEGTALSRPLGPISDQSNQTLLGPHAATEESMTEKLVWVPGLMGGMVPTSEVMALYIQTFQELFASTSRRVIDATEGGAYKKGTEVKTLSQALRICTPALMGDLSTTPARALAGLTPSQPEDGFKAIARQVKAMAADLAEKREEADWILNECANLEREIRRGPALYQLPEWLEMEDRFRNLYHHDTVKIALEQAMFTATYYFAQKEEPSQVGVRLDKYRTYFRTLKQMAGQFETVLAETAERINTLADS